MSFEVVWPELTPQTGSVWGSGLSDIFAFAFCHLHDGTALCLNSPLPSRWSGHSYWSDNDDSHNLHRASHRRAYP